MSAHGTPPSLSAELRIRRVWVPVLVGIFLCAVVLTFWRTLKNQEHADLQNKVKVEAEYLASHVEADLRNRIPALQRIARRWDVHHGMSKEEFTAEARASHADLPGFQALEWVDRAFLVRWIEPLEGNESALDQNLAFEKTRRVTMLKARDSGSLTLSSPIDLVQGGKGLLAFIPVSSGNDSDGWVGAVFRIQDWLDYVLGLRLDKLSAQDYQLAASIDEQLVYRQSGWDQETQSGISQSATLPFAEHQFTIHVRPTTKFILRNVTHVPMLTAVFGALLSALVVIAVYLAQKAAAEAMRKQAAKAALEREVQQRAIVEHELHRALMRIDLATKAGSMGVWTWDLSNDQLIWNEKMFELFEVPPDINPTYDTWRRAFHPDDALHAEALLRDAVAGRAVFETDFRIVLAGGSVRYIRAAARVERDSENRPLSVTGLNWDVTERKQKQEALAKSEQQVRLLLNSTAEAIYGIDLEGNCTFANPACARLLGYPDAEKLLGKNMHDLIHHSYADGQRMPKEACKIYKAYRHGSNQHVDDEVLWRADGTAFAAEYWSYPQWDNNKIHGAVVTFIDITERKQAEEKIRHMANHDGLTDLPSLRLLRDRLAMAVHQARRYKKQAAVLFVDLDGFKGVNDTYGHDAGDEVLKEVALRLTAATRATDTVARIGGDEFLLVLTELQTAQNAAVVAKKILELMCQPIQWAQQEVCVGASIGIAMFPGDGMDIDHLIKRADEAMYKVKASGKHGYRFAASAVKVQMPMFSSMPSD